MARIKYSLTTGVSAFCSRMVCSVANSLSVNPGASMLTKKKIKLPYAMVV